MRSLVLFGLVWMVSLAAVVPASASESEFYWRTSKNALVHWDRGEVRIPVDPELVAYFGPRLKDALEQAAAEWSVSQNIPLIRFDYAPSEADRAAALDKTGNWLGLARSWEFGDELAITVSTSDAVSGSVLASQVWINARRPLALLAGERDEPSESYDLQGVLTHEFGHVLGLGEGPEHTLATMNPNFKRGELHQRTVDVIDEDAVITLYERVGSANAAGASSCTLKQGARGESPRGVWFALFAAVGLCRLVPAGLRRRPRG
jgi:hypothetical protein